MIIYNYQYWTVVFQTHRRGYMSTRIRPYALCVATKYPVPIQSPTCPHYPVSLPPHYCPTSYLLLPPLHTCPLHPLHPFLRLFLRLHLYLRLRLYIYFCLCIRIRTHPRLRTCLLPPVSLGRLFHPDLTTALVPATPASYPTPGNVLHHHIMIPGYVRLNILETIHPHCVPQSGILPRTLQMIPFHLTQKPLQHPIMELSQKLLDMGYHNPRL